MDIEIVKEFCSKDERKRNILEPFTIGEYTLATDGLVMIRVPRLAEVPENPDAPAINFVATHSIGGVFLKEPAQWSPIPAVSVAPVDCPECKGSGKAVVCPECKGEGEVELETEFSRYDAQECKSCDSCGQVSEEYFRDMLKGWPWLKGEVTSCNNCRDGKVFREVGELVGGVMFSPRHLALLSKLPGVEIGAFGATDTARFRFDGGDGLILPLR